MSLSDPKKAPSFVNPIVPVNGYLWDTMKKIDPELTGVYGQSIPIIPLHDSAAGKMPWESKPYLIYNKAFARPTGPFYPIKRETFHYALKADVGSTLEWLPVIQAILDRQDDAAKDINAWNGSRPDVYPVFFHHLRVFQIEKTDPRDYGVKLFHVTEFMVDVEYHYTESLNDIFEKQRNA